MEYIKIPIPLESEIEINNIMKIGVGAPTSPDSNIVVSTWDIPGQGKYFSVIKLELFGRELFIGGDFFTNWRNVYRHPIIWFLSK